MGVLPFFTDHAPNEENLAFSLSQEIAAALARLRWFDVSAPGWSLTQRSRATDMSDDSLQRLDYVVDGAVSYAGKRFQVSVRLLDLAQHARPVWSDRFAVTIGKLHRFNDQVAARIAGRIDPVILFFEDQPQRRERDGASGLLLRAIPLMYSMDRRQYEEAGCLINEALEMEPDNAIVAAWAGFWHVVHVGQGWTRDVAGASAIAREHAGRAIGLAPDNAETLGICGHVCSFLNRDFDTALYNFDRALRLDPGLASTWAWSALTCCYVGKPGLALQRLKRYRDLAPFDPDHSWSQSIHAIAHAFAGDYEKAVEFGRRVTKTYSEFTNGYKPLIASLGHLGRRDEAEPYVDKLLSLEPDFTVERFGRVYPFKYTSDRDHYMTGLRLAGVPER